MKKQVTGRYAWRLDSHRESLRCAQEATDHVELKRLVSRDGDATMENICGSLFPVTARGIGNFSR